MALETFLDGKIGLCCGDSWHFLRDQPDNRYDSCVTDPPYALVSIVKRFGKANAAPAKGNEAFVRASRGFMGKQWDNGDSAHSVEFWAEVLRVLKPGAHVVAFAGTRTYHRLACAIEDAGFEIRDQFAWIFGSGFPKSHNVGNGWGTAVKPAWEPICVGRKPLSEKTVAANVLKWGTGAINIDGCRVHGEDVSGPRHRHGGGVVGAGTSFEMPDSKGELPPGRFPANVVHDGSEEVLAAFPESGPPCGSAKKSSTQGEIASPLSRPGSNAAYVGDTGSAARFFYTAKADADERIGSKHPTVKPLDLMQWLVRLITPKGGLVLDPFAGTGTTAEACLREGMRCMLVERETEYQACVRRRMRLVMAGPEERSRESIKASGKTADPGPLFAAQENPASETLAKLRSRIRPMSVPRIDPGALGE